MCIVSFTSRDSVKWVPSSSHFADKDPKAQGSEGHRQQEMAEPRFKPRAALLHGPGKAALGSPGGCHVREKGGSWAEQGEDMSEHKGT